MVLSNKHWLKLAFGVPALIFLTCTLISFFISFQKHPEQLSEPVTIIKAFGVQKFAASIAFHIDGNQELIAACENGQQKANLGC